MWPYCFYMYDKRYNKDKAGLCTLSKAFLKLTHVLHLLLLQVINITEARLHC